MVILLTVFGLRKILAMKLPIKICLGLWITLRLSMKSADFTIQRQTVTGFDGAKP